MRRSASVAARLGLVALVLVALGGSAARTALASRAPGAAERRAILAALPKNPYLHQACLRYKVRVSSVNPKYAYVEFIFPKQLPHGCKAFNGLSVMRHGRDGRWRQVYAGSAFWCDGVVPERVIREFFRNCSFGQSAHFYSPSGNLECVVRGHGAVLACVAFSSGRSAYLSRSGAVRVHAPPAASFFRQGPGIVLPYGQAWTCTRAGCPSRKPFLCESLKTGMKCYVFRQSGPEHGFLIARRGVSSF
jgi:hypothetical protein